MLPPTPAAPDLEADHERFAYSFLPGTLFVGLMWLVALLTFLSGVELNWLGIRPRALLGLIGVVTGPFIHAGLIHLLSNSFPLVLLSGFILFLHRFAAVRVFVLVYVLSGLLTWLIGRDAYHVGASGVVYGLAGFLLFNGMIRRDRAGLAVSLAILFLYSGLFYGLFPSEERISWEGHLSGLAAGLLAAVLYGDNVGDEKKEDELPAPPATDLARCQSSTFGQGYTWHYSIKTKHSHETVRTKGSINPQTGIVEPQTPLHHFSSKSR